MLSWDGLNRAASFQRPGTKQRLRLAKQGKEIPPKAYSVTSGANDPKVDFRAVARLLEDAATLVIERIDQVHEPIGDLCRMLEAELGSDADAFAFASWRETQGFPTHWDYEAGFILQLDGVKHWRVFAPERQYPTKQDFRNRHGKPPATPVWEGDLKPGDLLYMPGGWWHDALAKTSRTLHVSLGTYPQTGVDLLDHLLQELQDEENVRTPLPRFASESEQQKYIEGLRSAVDAKLRSLTVASVLQKFDAKAGARARLSLPWNAVQDDIPPEAWVHWLVPRSINLEKTSGDEITFEAVNDKITIAAIALPLIEDLAKRRKAQFRELRSAHPTLPVDAILLGLVSAGLIAIADSPVI